MSNYSFVLRAVKKKFLRLFRISTCLFFSVILSDQFFPTDPAGVGNKDLPASSFYAACPGITCRYAGIGTHVSFLWNGNSFCDLLYEQDDSGENLSRMLSMELLMLLLVVCAVLVTGFIILYRRKQSIDQQDLFARQMLDSMETERKRIASELHDSIGQELLIIKNRALLALNDLKNRKIVREQLEEISNTASQAIQETREITYNLRPYQIDRLGLTKAIESIINRAEHTTSIKFKADVDPMDNLIPKDMEIYVYRIVQECVNNIIKHSRATEGRITIKRWHNRLNIDVVDNGIGFDFSAEKLRAGRGLGLHGIIERTRLIGGTMRIESNPGKGTRVLMTIKTFEQTYATQ